jgi:hypothetical protein
MMSVGIPKNPALRFRVDLKDVSRVEGEVRVEGTIVSPHGVARDFQSQVLGLYRPRFEKLDLTILRGKYEALEVLRDTFSCREESADLVTFILGGDDFVQWHANKGFIAGMRT